MDYTSRLDYPRVKIVITNAIIPPSVSIGEQFILTMERVDPQEVLDAVDEADIVKSYVRHPSTCKVLGIEHASPEDHYEPQYDDWYYAVRLRNGFERGREHEVSIYDLECFYVKVDYPKV